MSDELDGEDGRPDAAKVGDGGVLEAGDHGVGDGGGDLDHRDRGGRIDAECDRLVRLRELGRALRGQVVRAAN